MTTEMNLNYFDFIWFDLNIRLIKQTKAADNHVTQGASDMF